MKRIISISLFALILAACSAEGGEDTTTTADPATTTTSETVTSTTVETTTTEGSEQTSTSASSGGSVDMAESSLGPVLVNDEGFTIYVFTQDTDTTSTCYGGCEDTWPPVPAGLTAGDGVTATLGETTRDDGSSQLTVNGRPVYTYADDEAPGDVNGQGVGGVWFTVSPAGDTVTG